MVRSAAIACLALALTGGPAVADGAALLAALNAAHKYRQTLETDRFAEAPPSVSPGTPFSVVVKPCDGQVLGARCDASYWSYKDGDFTVSTSVRIKKLDIASTVTPGKSYVGTNSFGASTRISVETVKVIALRPTSIPADGGDLSRLINVFDYTEKVAGSEARRLSTTVRVLIEGVVTDDGKGAECESRTTTPTLDRPYENTTVTCSVAADIRRIAVVDGAKVLQEWTIP